MPLICKDLHFLKWKLKKEKKVEVMEQILFASKKAYSGYVVRRWLRDDFM